MSRAWFYFAVIYSMLGMAGVSVSVSLLVGQDKQTAALTRIAVATEATQANTHTPVAVEVSGFSPEAQQVFNQALKTKGK